MYLAYDSKACKAEVDVLRATAGIRLSIHMQCYTLRLWPQQRNRDRLWNITKHLKQN